PRAPHEPRHRHLHPGEGGHAQDRGGRPRGVGRRRPRRGALFPARVHVQVAKGQQARQVVPDRPQGLVAPGGLREEPARLRAGLGGRHSGQHVRGPPDYGRRQEHPHGAHGDRVHGRARQVVYAHGGPARHGRGLGRLLPDRRRDRGRLPDLRRADAPPGPRQEEHPALGLLLPDQRLDHELRQLLGRRAEREDHLGQAGSVHAEVHHRIRRHDRGPSRLCLGARRVKMPNRLANATSPYLLQHAGNPVDWFQWGDEAFGAARAGDRPIFLSIGYSTCHWCHVMAHESFENEAVAALMNENFVCIKLDREERPDVDRVYMAYLQALTGQGGWPLSVWLTPDLKPFYAGTYFAPEDGGGRAGFPTVLRAIARGWREDRASLVAEAERVVDTLGGGRASDGAAPAAATLAEAAG